MLYYFDKHDDENSLIPYKTKTEVFFNIKKYVVIHVIDQNHGNG